MCGGRVASGLEFLEGCFWSEWCCDGVSLCLILLCECIFNTTLVGRGGNSPVRSIGGKGSKGGAFMWSAFLLRPSHMLGAKKK